MLLTLSAFSSEKSKRMVIEAAISIAVFFLALLFCFQKINWMQFEGKVSQVSFASAVSMVCDGKFQKYKAPPSELVDFLHAKNKKIQCDQIAQQEKMESSGFEKAHLYLLSSVALFWFVFGLTWKSVIIFCATMYAISTLATYMLLRLWLPRVVSLCFAAVFCVSSIHLAYVAWLRDYSKAPFILLLLFIIGWLAKQEKITRQTYWLCGVGGVVVGVGMGFRMDVVLFFPILLLTVFLMPGAVRNGSRWAEKIKVSAVFLFAFLLMGFPIIQALGGGSNIYHFALLGLTDAFNGALGVASAQHDLGGFFGSESE